MSDTAEHDQQTRIRPKPRGEEQRVDRPQAPPQSSRRDDPADQHDTGDRGSDTGQRRKSRWPLIVLILVIVIAVIAGFIYWQSTAGLVSTTDAYTQGNAISIAPKIAGDVTSLAVNDNTFVKAGQVLLTIDSRPFVAQVNQARANLVLAQRQLAGAQVSLAMTRVRAPASLQEAQAQLAAAQANHLNAEREYRREHAVNPQATSQQLIDQADAQMRTSTAQVATAEAQVKAASLVDQTIKAAEDAVGEREAQVAQAKANLDQAEVNLSYTVLRAPQDGWITQRNVDRGTFVQAGQQVFYIVTQPVWVVANFKETKLARMKPGQKVTISVDAYPKLHLTGHVGSIQMGSGAQFSAFPAENATGNFVKIVRRVPVKIIIDHGLHGQALPLGLSVEPTVTVK